jgi:hypothetical protein
MKFRIFIAAMAMALTATNAAAVGSLADITIYDRAENRVLPVYFHDGRYYVVGKPGNEYQLTIRNQQAADIMAVVSVDGVNAVSGETAHWSQTGYVFGANASFSVKGWRKSLQQVARFYFTEIENSYAARTGRPDNVGVIGVAVFRRKAEPAVSLGRLERDRREASRADAAPAEAQGAAAEAPAKSAASGAANSAADTASRRAPAAAPAQPPERSLGTGHGAGESSPVRYTSFERASPSPDEVITIYYDSYRNLLAQGVIKPPVLARPMPFPGQFVPDPR